MKPLAVVTGGASGIGFAVAERLLEDGWAVAILDANREALAEAEAQIGHDALLCLACDITDEDDVEECFDAAAGQFGPVAGLVNCAGIARGLAAMDTPVDLFRRMLDVNLIGSFIAARAAVRRMGDDLSVVNITSVSGLRANAGRMAYGASKAGVKLMTEVLAVELGASGVRVNAIAPGPVETPMVAKLHGEAERAQWLDRLPQRRYGDPDEIAAAAAFLLSQEASFVNGHTLVVDGGFLAAGVMV